MPVKAEVVAGILDGEKVEDGAVEPFEEGEDDEDGPAEAGLQATGWQAVEFLDGCFG